MTEKQSGVAHFREVTYLDQVFFCFQEEGLPDGRLLDRCLFGESWLYTSSFSFEQFQVSTK